MTKACFYKADNLFSGFEISGHALLLEDGPDVLCAAVSSMTSLVVNTLTDVFGAELLFKENEALAVISAKVISCPDENRYAVSGVIEGFILQLQDLALQYPDNLNVTVKQNTTKG